MKANRYGLGNGNTIRWRNNYEKPILDNVEGCFRGVYELATTKYGPDAYGPLGSLINTYHEFHVKNEFTPITEDDGHKNLRLTTTMT